MPGLHQFSFRRAVLEKWREKYGQGATYRKLVESFHNAGKLSLAEAVCEVLTNTSQLLYSPSQGQQLVTNSWACKRYVLCIIAAVVSVLLALYISQNAILLNENCFSYTNMDNDDEKRPGISVRCAPLPD